MVNPKQHTVQQLVELWKDTDLSVSDGTAEATGVDDITVSYEGSDGTLEVDYTLSNEGVRTNPNENFRVTE